jgi:hypothetical protein
MLLGFDLRDCRRAKDERPITLMQRRGISTTYNSCTKMEDINDIQPNIISDKISTMKHQRACAKQLPVL